MKKKMNLMLSRFLECRVGYFISLILVIYLPQVVYIAQFHRFQARSLRGTLTDLGLSFVLVCALAHLVSLITPPTHKTICTCPAVCLLVYMDTVSGCFPGGNISDNRN